MRKRTISYITIQFGIITLSFFLWNSVLPLYATKSVLMHFEDYCYHQNEQMIVNSIYFNSPYYRGLFENKNNVKRIYQEMQNFEQGFEILNFVHCLGVVPQEDQLRELIVITLQKKVKRDGEEKYFYDIELINTIDGWKVLKYYFPVI